MSPTLPTWAYLYPWDVDGDPAAASRVADLGVAGVCLAAVYHATRALTPRHPLHRVVTADRSAAYFPFPAAPDGDPTSAAAPFGLASHRTDPFGAAAAALAAAGLPVTGWAVLLHVDGLTGGPTVVNAYGDAYPWALCAAAPESVDYACTVAAAAAARPGLGALELEACGWYGFGHLHAHDKTAGVRVAGAVDFLMSLCFCAACRRGYASVGLDAERLRTRTVAVLDGVFSGTAALDGDWPAVEGALGAGVATAVLGWRDRAGDALRTAAVAAVRGVAGALPVLLHADPARHRTGANVGLDVPTALRTADGVVVQAGRLAATRAATARVAATTASGLVAATMQAVRGLGGQPDSLRAQLDSAAAAGASQARFYHAGLAGPADLAAMRTALAG